MPIAKCKLFFFSYVFHFGGNLNNVHHSSRVYTSISTFVHHSCVLAGKTSPRAFFCFGGKQKLTKAIYERKQPLETTLQQSERFLESTAEQLPPSQKSELDSKMTSLEARWNKLQSELDNRYMRLVVIHEKLTRFEELLHPFLVSFTCRKQN